MPSNLVATVLQDYIVDYQPRIDANEQRGSIYGALQLAKNQTNSAQSILDPSVRQRIQNSFNQNVKIPVINYKDVTITNVRTCAMQTEGLNSSLLTLTAVTYAFGFIAYPMQHYENYISYSYAIQRLIDAGCQKLAKTIDAGVVNLLETSKNQYYPQALLDYYAEVGDAIQVPQAGKNDFYNQMGSIMQTADFGGSYDVLTNPIGMGGVRRLQVQGDNSLVNNSFQLLGYTWYTSNSVVNGGPTIESTAYIVTQGAIALESRVDPDSKARSYIHESKYWEVFPNAPYVGMDLGVFYQADCADASALQAATLAKFTATKVESWQFSVDVFYVKAYNSDAANRYSGIFKVEILK